MSKNTNIAFLITLENYNNNYFHRMTLRCFANTSEYDEEKIQHQMQN